MTTTQTDQPAQPNITTGAPSTWPFVPGLAWAAVLLGILTWWLSKSELDLPAPIVLGTGLLALGSLALFVWMGVQWFRARKNTAQLMDIDVKARPVLAVAMLVGGGLLLFLGVWLYIVERMNAFSLVASMVVMALICEVAGWALRITPRSPLAPQSIFEGLLRQRRGVALALMVVGVAVGALGIYFFSQGGFTNFRANYPGGPEGVGLFLIGMALLGGGLYVQLTLDRPATANTMRLLVLYAGSMTGFLIAVFTAVRVAAWWKLQFAGGMTAWQGATAWQLWLCIYTGIFGLVLLFGSLLLARVDIRANVAIRRTLYGYNAVLNGLLLSFVLVLLNIIVFVTVPSNVEWTRSGLHTLSTKSVQMMQSLKDRVKVYVLMQRYSELSLDVSDLLDNLQSETDKLTVEFLSPDVDAARYRELASKYPELEKQTKTDFRSSGGYGRGLLVVYGEGTEGAKLPHVFIADKDLESGDQKEGTRFFLGENAIIQAIQQLATQGKRAKVYFTQLSGELMMNNRNIPDGRILRLIGSADVADRLRKDSYDVQGLIWDSKPPGKIPDMFAFAKKSAGDASKVPDDCSVLVIAGPERAFAKDALKAIDDYMEKGGKIVVLTKAAILPNGEYTDDGMPDLCKKFGVQVTNDFIIRYSDRDQEEIWLVKAQVPAQTMNRVAKEFARKSFGFYAPRTVKPMKGVSQYQTETILEVAPDANGGLVWADTDASELMRPLAYVKELRASGKLDKLIAQEPLPVAVAITDRDGKPRGFVIGDYGFISSSILQTEPVQGPVNYDFFRSCLEVLSDRPTSNPGIGPKESASVAISKSDVSMGRMLVLPLSLMVLALAGTGAGIWIVRRK